MLATWISYICHWFSERYLAFIRHYLSQGYKKFNISNTPGDWGEGDYKLSAEFTHYKVTSNNFSLAIRRLQLNTRSI